MERDYRETLQRIILHRKICQVSQKRMGEFLGISQSQYSKMELGRLEIPFEVVDSWAQAGWDVDYFVTGRQRLDADCLELSGEYILNGRQELFEELFDRFDSGDIGLCPEAGNEERALRQLVKQPGEHYLLCNARQLNGMSQEVMSRCLGIGVRKYRRMEQGGGTPGFKDDGSVVQDNRIYSVAVY